MTAHDVSAALRNVATPERARANAWFFKTGPGEYGEGDMFVGATVPQQRVVAKKFEELPQVEIERLLHSPWHEERLTAIFIMVARFKKGTEDEKTEVANLYLENLEHINNWDLVDSSAPYILGPWLQNSRYKMKTLQKLALSDNLWERRISIITTLHYIGQGSGVETLVLAEKLVDDTHDLIQKAVGWCLREVGKRVDDELLLDFLDRHAATMPRTALRYAIERLTPETRRHYMGLRG